MRLVILLLVTLFSVPEVAAQVSDESSPEAPDAVTPNTSKTQVAKPSMAFAYNRGRKVSKAGVIVGTVGATAVASGVGMVFVGLAMGSDFQFGDHQWLPYTGLTFVIGGLGVVQVGAPMAAIGTAMSHRALVNGGLAERGACGGCIAATVLSVPNPMFFASLPLSYVVSALQRYDDRKIRQRVDNNQPFSPKFGVSPNALTVSMQF